MLSFFRHINRSNFELGHLLSGQEYFSLQFMPDKITKLTNSNTILRANNFMRISVGDVDDPDNVIDVIYCFLLKISPSQERLYFKPASAVQNLRFEVKGYPDASFSSKEQIGMNTVTKLVRAAAAKLRFDSCGRAIRHLFLTMLVNEPKVSTEEALASARNKSVAAQHLYMARGTVLEMAKFRALGLVKK